MQDTWVQSLGRSPGGQHGNTLQYPSLDNSMNRGAWQSTVHGVARSWTGLFSLWSCMDVRVGLCRRLSAKELMLFNLGVGEDSWESLGLQGNPTSPFWRRSALGFLWREWCWSWSSSTLATSCEELTYWKRLWCWEGLGRRRRGRQRMRWVNSGSWWWTGRPGVLRFMGSRRVGHDWATEMKWMKQPSMCSLMSTFKTWFLSLFQICNTVSLTVVSMLYVTSPELIHR